MVEKIRLEAIEKENMERQEAEEEIIRQKRQEEWVRESSQHRLTLRSVHCNLKIECRRVPNVFMLRSSAEWSL